VTDKDGNPVTDLDLSYFELYDNGKLKTLTEFERHTLTLPIETPRVEKPKEKEIQSEKPATINRKFLLFFDFAFNEFAGILKARRAALHFIDTQIHPEDEVGVITYDTFRGLTLREYFTADHEKVRRVIEGFGGKDIQGRAENIFRDYWGRKAGLDWMEGKRAKIAKNQEENYVIQVKNFSKEIGDMARALRYIPGSKHIILFSSGIANSILYGSQMPESVLMGGGVIVRGAKMGDSGLREIYEKMSEELAAANCPVYPINTAGKSVSHFRTRDSMGDYSMRQMAKISGGDYYDNISGYEEILEKIQNITSSYYVLGYYIDEKWDGKFHKIKVKVKRKGCRVFGQTGYFNPKPFTEYTELERLMHLIDLALSEKPLLQEPLNFSLLTLPFSDKDKPNLAVIAKTPGKLLKDISGDRMEVVILVFDKENNITLIQEKRASAINLARQSLYIYSFCSLSPGDYECRVVIRNLKTGQGAVASSSITIPAGKDSGFKLYPPLLLVPENKALYIKGEEKDRKSTDLSLSDIFPFDTTQYAPVVKELDGDTTKIIAVLRCISGGITEPEISLTARLVSSTSSEEIPIPLKILDQTQDQNVLIYSLELSLPVLQPGYHLLILSADEHKSRTISRTVTEIKIR
jgi:VWFA-related protein